MWQIKIHRLVLKEDFSALHHTDQIFILKTIQKKLSIDPQAYGKPLKGEFSGYWRLRVSDFRIIYKISKEEVVVLIVKIGIRKDDRVYQEFFSRLKKL